MKAIAVHAMKAQNRNGGIYPLVINLCIRRRRAVTFRPRTLYHRERKTMFPFNRKLGGPRSRSGCCRGEKNFLHLRGFETLIAYPVA